MKALCGLLLSTLILVIFAQYGIRPEEQQDQQEEPMMWMGPGWYYGYYFNNRMQYDTWCVHHFHQFPENKETE